MSKPNYALPKLSELQPEEKRILCAEACGIPKHARFYAQDHGGKTWWNYITRAEAERDFKIFGEKEHPIEECWITAWLPKYDISLDVMAEARKHLNEKEKADYCEHLG